MSLDRKKRRASARRNFKLLAGGKVDDAKALKALEVLRGAAETPVGRFAVALDVFTCEQCAKDPKLTPMDVLAALMRFAAGVAAESEAPEGECAEAFGMFIAEEKRLRKEKT
jgi:hypothetical protein